MQDTMRDFNCALLGHYAASSGNLLPTFRDNLSVSSFLDLFLFLTLFHPLPLKTGPIGCPATSVRNYQYWLPNNQSERSFHGALYFIKVKF